MGGRGGAGGASRFMVYAKRSTDKRYKPVDVNTFSQYDRVAYAPIYDGKQYQNIKKYISRAPKLAPDLRIQIRDPGSGKVIYDPFAPRKKRRK